MSENVLERLQVSFGFNIEAVYDVLESLRISLSVMPPSPYALRFDH